MDTPPHPSPLPAGEGARRLLPTAYCLLPTRSAAVSRRTPYGDLVRQYLDLRDEHPGVLLLFRVGSFYEVLFEDAELVARELGLKLGERPSSGSAGTVPQCGFAHHALDAFLPRLLGRGYRVAVCEEGDPDSQPAPLPG